MVIHLVDLNRQYMSIKKSIDSAIDGVLNSGHFILGDNVELFEKEFAKYCGVKHAVALNSGTDALLFSLKSLGIGNGDEVITAANTFVATVNAITLVGAKPVLVDVNKENYNIDVEQLKYKITDKTKAIIPVHMYGQMCDMNPILKLAKKHGLRVIEDACQAHGAEYKGQRTGSFGDLACFSFYPSKNLGAYGDGGMATTDSGGLAEKLKLLRNYGQRAKYYHDVIGWNSRLDEIQAAILRVKLGHLEKWIECRGLAAERYDTALADIDEIVVPVKMKNSRHVYYLYVVRCERRDGLQTSLKSNGIETGIHYPVPIHMQKAYLFLGYNEGSFPVAEKAAKDILSIPMFPEIRASEIKLVVDSIRKYYASGS